MQQLLIKPGLVYIINSLNVQAIRWLCANQPCKFLYDPTVLEIEAALNTDWGEPTQVIIVLTQKKSFVPGYVLQTDPKNTGFVTSLSTKLDLKNYVDNTQIFELSCSYTIQDYLNNAGIRLEDSLISKSSLDKWPTSFYKKYIGVAGIGEGELENSLDKGYFDYLEALATPEGLQKYWINIDKAAAMRLFASPQANFINFLSEPQRSCSTVAIFLNPYVRAFRKSSKVEYLQDFGRWLFAQQVWAADRRKLGVMQMINAVPGAKSKSYIFCNFEERALVTWAKQVKYIQQSLNY